MVCSWESSKVYDLRETGLQHFNQLVIRSYQAAVLFFGKGDVQAVVDSDFGLGGNRVGARNERDRWHQQRSCLHHVVPVDATMRRSDSPLAFGFREGMNNLDGKYVGRE